jgi:perosamine synthetase
MRIPIARPFFDQGSFEAVTRPLRSGWVAQGPEVERFEQRFATTVGARYAVACSSGTAALHLALTALRIGPGDEVVLPSFTWVATANAVEQCGATPVFCDVDLATFNVTPERMAEQISPATRALIPVHLFGLAAPLAQIASIADERNVALIEDAACALGARVGQVRLGAATTSMAAFSFHPRKVITTGEGGIITCSDPDRAQLLRSLRSHGVGVSARISQPTAPRRAGSTTSNVRGSTTA